MLHQARAAIVLSSLFIGAVSAFPATAIAQMTVGQGEAQVSRAASAQAKSTPVSDLDADPRLRRYVSFHQPPTTTAEALRVLSQQTGILFTAAAPEVARQKLCCSFDDVTLRDALDSLQHVRDWEWRLKPDGAWALQLQANPHRLDAYQPENEAQLEAMLTTRELFAQVMQQPPDLLQRLYSPNGKNLHGVPYSELPASLRQLVDTYIAAEVRDVQITGGGGMNENFAALLPTTRIHIAKGVVPPELDFDSHIVTGYALSITGPNGGGTFGFGVFTDPRFDLHVISPRQGYAWYGEQEDASTRQTALASDARLKTPVTVSGDGLTRWEALRRLAIATRISFAAEWVELNPQRKSFRYVNVPLKDVLADLNHRYGFTWRHVECPFTWGSTEGGVLLFHAPEPPPRLTTGAVPPNP